MEALKFIWDFHDYQKSLNDSVLVYYGYKNPFKVYLESMINSNIKNYVFNSLMCYR